MKIQDFAEKYSLDRRPIDAVIQRWVLEKRVSDFLGTTVFAGVTVADLMLGDRLVDTLSPATREAFANLMGRSADTREEIQQLILSKVASGDESVLGLMNKIQGQLGEDTFIRLADSGAQLAPSGSQEGWDVRVPRGDSFEYVQIKTYDDPSGVLDHLRRLKEKVAAGAISDSDSPVSHIDVAVTSDMYETVSEKALQMGYPGKVLDLGVTHEELRNTLVDSFSNVENPLQQFLGELLGDVGNPAALHAITNAFLLYKGAKERRAAIEDTLYGSTISAGGLLVGSAVDQILGHALLLSDLQDAAVLLSGPAGGILILGVSMSTRALLRRIADRRFVVDRLVAGNESFGHLVTHVDALSY